MTSFIVSFHKVIEQLLNKTFFFLMKTHTMYISCKLVSVCMSTCKSVYYKVLSEQLFYCILLLEIYLVIEMLYSFYLN